jgi:hypothetical protein
VGAEAGEPAIGKFSVTCISCPVLSQENRWWPI